MNHEHKYPLIHKLLLHQVISCHSFRVFQLFFYEYYNYMFFYINMLYSFLSVLILVIQVSIYIYYRFLEIQFILCVVIFRINKFI